MTRDPILEQLEQSKKDALAANEAEFAAWLKNDFTFMLLEDFETEKKSIEKEILAGFETTIPIEKLHRLSGKLSYVKGFNLRRLLQRRTDEIEKAFRARPSDTQKVADAWKI